MYTVIIVWGFHSDETWWRTRRSHLSLFRKVKFKKKKKKKSPSVLFLSPRRDVFTTTVQNSRDVLNFEQNNAFSDRAHAYTVVFWRFQVLRGTCPTCITNELPRRHNTYVSIYHQTRTLSSKNPNLTSSRAIKFRSCNAFPRVVQSIMERFVYGRFRRKSNPQAIFRLFFVFLNFFFQNVQQSNVIPVVFYFIKRRTHGRTTTRSLGFGFRGKYSVANR